MPTVHQVAVGFFPARNDRQAPFNKNTNDEISGVESSSYIIL